MAATSRSDGGRWALAGFLYQILATAGLKASSQVGESGDETDLNVLLKLVRNGRVKQEEFNQDAVIRSVLEGQEGLVLVQFKYSGTSPPRPLYRDELNVIIEHLAKSQEMAEAQRYRVTGYYLLTNREVRVSSDLNPLKSGEKSTEPPDKTDDSTDNSNKETRELQATNRPPPSNTREDQVKQRLTVLSDLPVKYWTCQLTAFADTLGCLRNEIETGIDQLVGHILRRTAGGDDLSIEQADLLDAFTGCRTTRTLTKDQRNAKSLEQIDRLAKLLHPNQPIRRILLDELDRVIGQRALVVLKGPGGSGKSTALVDWARRIVESPSPRPGALTSMVPMKDIQPHWITQFICNCFEIPSVHHGRRSEPADLALERLETAVPERRPPCANLGPRWS